ncbi:MAG TPA: hypothetical protein VMV15_12710 [Candidatus Binataceae bacterium]|nr:hypothetical protein [Candidatus Binataceae bacterium]
MQFPGRSIIAGTIVLAALTFTGIRRVQAQGQQPDLNMLLNLDLFSSSADADQAQPPAPGGSMLDQIQALRQMGYLHGNGEDAPPPPPPGYSGEGPPYPLSGEAGPFPPLNNAPDVNTLMPWLYDFLGGGR